MTLRTAVPIVETTSRLQDRIYSNLGNAPLVDLLSDCSRVLDVGCGAGDNALLVRTRHQTCQVFGISHSAAEAKVARKNKAYRWVYDLEAELPPDLADQTSDVLVFAHVLKHLRDPATVLARFVSLLREGGQVLIAVPNVLSWRMRLQFLFGRLEYEEAGVLDDTHLRFFTYFTAHRFLLSCAPDLLVLSKSATGSVPIWWLGRYLLPKQWCARIDQWGCRHWPNLFGGPVLIKTVKK